ncbi:MAG: hypothetical protein WCO33_03445 [bacterium]
MKNFILIFKGGAGMASNDEERKQEIEKWTHWYTELGSHLVDPGFPFIPKTEKKITKVKVEISKLGATGYTIIKFGNMNEAIEFSKSCPVLENGGEVHVYEQMEMQGM